MGNSTGNVDKKKKKTTKTGQMIKQKKDAGAYRDKKEKDIQGKKIQLEEIKQKVLAKEGGLKRYRQFRQNRTFQNNERKFY